MPPASTRIKMSDEYQIPFHIHIEIMKMLPVKSLIQCRIVSKSWKSLIDTSEFIAAHTFHRHSQPQHLLVSYRDERGETNYVSYIDNNTFPHQRSRPTLPLSIKNLKLPIVVGSSHGLLCLYGSDPNSTTKTAVLWNPTIRKSIIVAFPNTKYVPGQRFVGFGVCPVTYDPKIVSITQSFRNVTDLETKVMVYTLSSRKWRSLSTNLPTKPLRDMCLKVVTNGFIYWIAGQPAHSMLISFDVTNESFEVIDLPDTLARVNPNELYISKIRDSLAILEYYGCCCDVWMMENGVQRSFREVFTIHIQTLDDTIVGFRKNGVPMVQLADGIDFDDSDDDDSDDDNDYDDVEVTKLVAHEPNSEDNTVLEIIESDCFFYVNSYMETLLLLGRSDSISY